VAVITPPIALQNAGSTHTAEMLRAAIGINMGAPRAAASLTPRSGINPFYGGAMAVTQQGSPTTGVQVASGICVVAGSENTKQGGYIVMNDAALNVAMTAAPGSNSRIDTIVVRIQDSVYSGATNTATIESITGTAAASPVAPTLPANTLALADVLIPSGDTAYTDSQITDRRTYAATGYILCRNSGDRPSPAVKGMAIYQLDTGEFLTYNGTSWVVPGSDNWVSYTPTWGGSTSNPSLGNGTITGSYMKQGNLVFVQIALVIGSTSTGGSGRWTFSLPFAAAQQTVLPALAEDTSATTRYGGSCWVTPGTGVFAVALGSGSNGVSSSVPFTWGAGDQLYIAGSYRCS
jgi:hypothetical protein